jgi:hypothetical protein
LISQLSDNGDEFAVDCSEMSVVNVHRHFSVGFLLSFENSIFINALESVTFQIFQFFFLIFSNF